MIFFVRFMDSYLKALLQISKLKGCRMERIATRYEYYKRQPVVQLIRKGLLTAPNKFNEMRRII
jgi:hypothetical protein